MEFLEQEFVLKLASNSTAYQRVYFLNSSLFKSFMGKMELKNEYNSQ